MLSGYLILSILWILYCLLHSILASLSFKTGISRLMGRSYKFYRLFYTVFAFAGLIAIFWYQLDLPVIWIYHPDFLSHAVGFIVGLSGLCLMLVCIKKYFMSLSGLKGLFRERALSELMIGGIHRYIRHPLYLGTFMFIWGLFLYVPVLSLLIADTIITIYTLIGIRLEENKLIAEFGDQYRSYQRKVPMLIPFFRPGNRYI